MKRIQDPRRCEACMKFHKCISLSNLRLLGEVHQMIGVVMVNAGLAKGVDADGNPVTPSRIVAPTGPLPIPRPLTPV